MIEKIKNELFRRKRILIQIEKDIAVLKEHIEKGSNNFQSNRKELLHMYKLQSQQKKQIKQLTEQNEVLISYQRIRKVRSSTIPSGVYTKLPWLPSPIMWCKDIDEKVEEILSNVTEEISLTEPAKNRIVNGCIYAVSGDTHGLIESYDLNEKKWTLAATMSTPRIGLGVAIINDELYTVGGVYENRDLSSVNRYNLVEKKWFSIAPMNSERSHCGVLPFAGQLYAIGGSTIFSNHLSSSERYDPKLNQWTMINQMNKKRSYLGLATLNGHLYAVGGNNGSQLSSVEKYNPTEDKWTIIAPMNSKRDGLGVATLNGKLYAVGGYNGYSDLSSVERYDPKKDKWTFVATMNYKRRYAYAMVISGHLYAFGGSMHCSGERYDPDNNKWTIDISINSNPVKSRAAALCYNELPKIPS